MYNFCLSNIIKQLEYMLEFDEKETKSEPRNTRSPKQITRSPIHIMENLRYKSKSKNLFMTHERTWKENIRKYKSQRKEVKERTTIKTKTTSEENRRFQLTLSTGLPVNKNILNFSREMKFFYKTETTYSTRNFRTGFTLFF